MKLIHLYSRKNSGDGLLVDLSVELLKECFGEIHLKSVVAIDPASFPEYENIVSSVPVAGSKGWRRLLEALEVFMYLIGVKRRLFRGVQGESVVAVGGGYVRNKTLKESIKFLLAHIPQLKYATSSYISRSIYLPQSIGPLRGLVGIYTMHLLRGVSIVFVRDDISFRMLSKYMTNVYRVPDLAVQKLALEYKGRQSRKLNKIYLIARQVDLGFSDEYEKRVRDLVNYFPNIEPILQSTGRGNNDSNFYDGIGFKGPYRTVQSALKTEPGVVISVRLHGAIQSIMLGCPTVHLSYERKGFGAYSDLNIDRYVHNYRSFDPKLVVQQVEELSGCNKNFWGNVERSLDKILACREFMKDKLKELGGLD